MEKNFCGDTWHKDADAAKEQAAFEFELLSEWIEVPSDVDDVVDFALSN